ncbi:MAG: hypothetical protein ACJ8FY_23405 [Gemmataceae bacterium]
MNPEWIYYILMGVAGLIGWIARPKLQPPGPAPAPADHPLLHLILTRAQDQIRQAIQDALDRATQDILKPPPKA